MRSGSCSSCSCDSSLPPGGIHIATARPPSAMYVFGWHSAPCTKKRHSRARRSRSGTAQLHSGSPANAPAIVAVTSSRSSGCATRAGTLRSSHNDDGAHEAPRRLGGRTQPAWVLTRLRLVSARRDLHAVRGARRRLRDLDPQHAVVVARRDRLRVDALGKRQRAREAAARALDTPVAVLVLGLLRAPLAGDRQDVV